jgi:hypothetical protein
MDIITRKDSTKCGKIHYFTGKPCKHGHIAPRYVKNRECVECAKIRLNTEKAKARRSVYYNSEYWKEYQKAYRKMRFDQGYTENPVKHRIRTIRWRKNNPDRCRELDRASHNRRMKNPSCLIEKRIRGRLRDVMQCRRPGKIDEYVGCDLDHLRDHIQSKFKFGMDWENHGLFGWHIDHIRPCASFDLTQPGEIEKCFHYTNLQPLWWYENLSKGSKIV